MIVAVDTDVWVNWLMSGAPHHEAARRFVEHQAMAENELGLTLQTLLELIPICTDPRRFPRPLGMEEALQWAQALWNGESIRKLTPSGDVMNRTAELMLQHGLGRKRILDTALAATLEAASVSTLATFNNKHFAVFSFLRIIVPA